MKVVVGGGYISCVGMKAGLHVDNRQTSLQTGPPTQGAQSEMLWLGTEPTTSVTDHVVQQASIRSLVLILVLISVQPDRPLVLTQ